MFVNTRSQAETLFQELSRYNNENLPIALHHGPLDVGQRRKVEAAMVAGTRVIVNKVGDGVFRRRVWLSFLRP